MKHRHCMPFGAQCGPEGTRFRLWAPDAKRVVLKVEAAQGGELQADLIEAEEGWYELVVAGVAAGARYCYRIDDRVDVTDPASRFNPLGVPGYSEIVDPEAFTWSDATWRGREWHEAVIYEVHVGTFTNEGSYAAMIARLQELSDVGITALELMPLAAFHGHRGWGYDGVLPFAPHAAYGRPDDLKRLIQAAHDRGLMVLLDVVYNHFGPEGNDVPQYAGGMFTDRHCTPWGKAIDFARPQVREFFIHNALYWLDEYRFDGLRLDAVHAIYDDSSPHFIDELVERIADGPGRERHVHVVLENGRNEARRLRSRQGASVAQWNDDFHHALHVVLTGESDGYYVDYADRPVERLGRVLAEGFAYQGEHSRFAGEPRGEPSAALPPAAFVSFLQNHDQIGNRALGERLACLAEPQPLRAALAILLLSPQIPLLFMGEDYGATQPFVYFCDYSGDLAAAVRNGRRAEFARFSAFADERARDSIPDPNAVGTFESSRLRWDERNDPTHARWRSYVRDLLQVRGRCVVPLLARICNGNDAQYEVRGPLLSVEWPAQHGPTLVLRANLDHTGREGNDLGNAELLFSTAGRQEQGSALAAWEVRLLRQRHG